MDQGWKIFWRNEDLRSGSFNKSLNSSEETMKDNHHEKKCDTHNDGQMCRLHRNSTLIKKSVEVEPSIQQLHGPPWIHPEDTTREEHKTNDENMNITSKKLL
ncbi:hypothetical protein GDO86_008778 [Hymenochirus boettgeri]|uniref:Uncharacterized protein n=1 Tax=Hymenochirus boettgeri TaxID=247094 RepID=A0A8T2J718_9PIPI|nr:hypothetical protein GDO86_008778 [Hymenochirus boettgeri]